MASPMAVKLCYYFWLGRLLLCILLLQNFLYLGLGGDFSIASRGTYYGSPDSLGTDGGACGYGSFGRNLNGGDVAAVARLYRNGTGCGACYQVRCTNGDLCTDGEVKIVVTDYGQGDRTDFIMSLHAYSQRARSGKASQLISLGVVDIEYQRISCQYVGYNIMFKIDSSSNFPDYLALMVFIRQAKRTFWLSNFTRHVVLLSKTAKLLPKNRLLNEEESYEWKTMHHSHGAVWDVVTPTRGALSLRFLVSDGSSQEWISADNVIPPDWRAGAEYNSGIQLF